MNVFGSELCVRFAINEWRLCFRFYVNLQFCIGEMSTSCRYSCKPCWMKAVLTRAPLPFCKLAVTVLIFGFCTFIKFGWGSEQCTLRMLQTKQLQPRFVSGTQIQWNEQNTKKFVTLLDCFVKFSTQILYLSESPLLYSSVDLQLSSADIFQVFCSLLQTKQLIQHLCLQRLVFTTHRWRKFIWITRFNLSQDLSNIKQQSLWVEIWIDIKTGGHINTPKRNIGY